MFTKILYVVFFVLATQAMAASPFTISGDKVSAIFNSAMVWKKIGGAIETITFKKHEGNTSTYAITSTEAMATPSSFGTTHYKQAPCLALVQVTAKGDDLAPQWEVTNVDYTACPSAQR